MQHCRNDRVWGCDLFLLETWDESSSLSDDEQLVQIFASFIQLPFAQRYVYTKRLKDSGFTKPTDLPQADQNLLNRLRKPEEVQPVEYIWLRTCYEDGSDAAFSALMSEIWYLTDFWVFQDARRYNFGGGDGWRRIFTRLPQLLDPKNMSPEEYEDEKHKALLECYEDEKEDIKEVEDIGGDVEEDGTYWPTLYSDFHRRSMVGMIWVLDDETLRGALKDPESATILVVFFDEMGRVIKHTRILAEEAGDAEVLIFETSLEETVPWLGADQGEDYDWEGPIGPATIIGEGSEAHRVPDVSLPAAENEPRASKL